MIYCSILYPPRFSARHGIHYILCQVAQLGHVDVREFDFTRNIIPEDIAQQPVTIAEKNNSDSYVLFNIERVLKQLLGVLGERSG